MTKLGKILLIGSLPFIVLVTSAQVVGPTVFTPRLTVSPGPLTVTTGLTTVEDLTINGTCTGCPTTNVPSANDEILRSDGAGGIKVNGDATITADDLTVGGQIISTTGGFVAPDVGVAGVAYGFANDPNLGLSRTAADQMQLAATNGVFMRMDWPDGISIGGLGVTQVPVTVTGQTTFTSSAGGGSSAPVYINNTSPAWSINESDGGTDDKRWDFIASAEQLQFRTVNDANNATATWAAVDRTDTTIDTVNFTATAVQANGSNVCTANGTNCPLTETSGQFQTAETTGCSNSHSLLFAYRKIGTEVFLQVKAGGDCTSDGSGFVQYANTNWPAALLPLTTLRMAIPFGTCGATVLQLVFQIGTTGSPLVDFRPTCAAASTLQIGSNLSMVVTYSTAFPSSPG